MQRFILFGFLRRLLQLPFYRRLLKKQMDRYIKKTQPSMSPTEEKLFTSEETIEVFHELKIYQIIEQLHKSGVSEADIQNIGLMDKNSGFFCAKPMR